MSTYIFKELKTKRLEIEALKILKVKKEDKLEELQNSIRISLQIMTISTLKIDGSNSFMINIFRHTKERFSRDFLKLFSAFYPLKK